MSDDASTPTCPDCAAAVVGRHHGFRDGCAGCCARAMSRGPHFHRVRTAGRLDRQYLAALAQFGLTHDAVKAAHAADAVNRG